MSAKRFHKTANLSSFILKHLTNFSSPIVNKTVIPRPYNQTEPPTQGQSIIEPARKAQKSKHRESIANHL